MSIRLPRPRVLVTVLTTPSTLSLRAVIWATVALRSSTPRSLPPTLMCAEVGRRGGRGVGQGVSGVGHGRQRDALSWISGASLRVPRRPPRTPSAGASRLPSRPVRGRITPRIPAGAVRTRCSWPPIRPLMPPTPEESPSVPSRPPRRPLVPPRRPPRSTRPPRCCRERWSGAAQSADAGQEAVLQAAPGRWRCRGCRRCHRRSGCRGRGPPVGTGRPRPSSMPVRVPSGRSVRLFRPRPPRRPCKAEDVDALDPDDAGVTHARRRRGVGVEAGDVDALDAEQALEDRQVGDAGPHDRAHGVLVLLASSLTGLIVPLARRPAPSGRLVPPPRRRYRGS